MVDEVEYSMFDEESRDIPVIVKWFPIQGFWAICHRKSHQPAFGSSVNKFDSRSEAIEFAENNDCRVIE